MGSSSERSMHTDTETQRSWNRVKLLLCDQTTPGNVWPDPIRPSAVIKHSDDHISCQEFKTTSNRLIYGNMNYTVRNTGNKNVIDYCKKHLRCTDRHHISTCVLFPADNTATITRYSETRRTMSLKHWSLTRPDPAKIIMLSRWP